MSDALVFPRHDKRLKDRDRYKNANPTRNVGIQLRYRDDMIRALLRQYPRATASDMEYMSHAVDRHMEVNRDLDPMRFPGFFNTRGPDGKTLDSLDIDHIVRPDMA